jgi:hypothetical protein
MPRHSKANGHPGVFTYYERSLVKGSVTGPLSDTIAVSLAGNYNKRDGYARYANLNLDTNNRNRYGVRGQILFQPSSDFKVRVIADYDNIDERCCTVANIYDGPTGGAVRGLGGQITSNQPFSYVGYANFPSSNKIDNYGVSAQMDWQFNDKFALTSISSYRAVKTNTDADSDFTSADLIGKNANQAKIDTFTQELRLQTSFDGPLNFLAGVFYSIHSLPAFWQAVSHFNPFFYMIDGFRHGFFGQSDISPWTSLAIVSAFFAVLAAVAINLLRHGYKLRH